jgi:hypothetical protein
MTLRALNKAIVSEADGGCCHPVWRSTASVFASAATSMNLRIAQ